MSMLSLETEKFCLLCFSVAKPVFPLFAQPTESYFSQAQQNDACW